MYLAKREANFNSLLAKEDSMRKMLPLVFTIFLFSYSLFSQKAELIISQDKVDTSFLNPISICSGEKISLLDYPILESGLYCKAYETKWRSDSILCVSIEVKPKPDLRLIGPPGNILKGEEVYLSLFSEINNLNEITWFKEDSVIGSNLPEIYVYPNQSENYKVRIKDANGCTNEALTRIIVNQERNIFIPNIFSPNSDGINDNFTLYAEEGALKIKSLRIFDHWGDLVFERLDFEPNITSLGWDGTFKKMKSTSSVFAFYAEVLWADGLEEVIKGEIKIVR